jgi:uncharacterized RDD family membrane protein YckC
MTDPNQPPEQQPPEQQPPSFEKPGEQPSAQQPPSYPPPPQHSQYQPQHQPPSPPPGFPQAPPANYQAAPTGPGGMVLDYGSGLYLPPGVELASNGRRIGAYFLAIPLFVVTLGIGYIIWGLILWNQGTSPALKVLGMRCWLVNEGRVPGFWRMALRDIIGRLVDGILSIITELVSFILFLTSGKRQSLHDLVGGTTVLYDPRKVLG